MPPPRLLRLRLPLDFEDEREPRDDFARDDDPERDRVTRLLFDDRLLDRIVRERLDVFDERVTRDEF